MSSFVERLTRTFSQGSAGATWPSEQRASMESIGREESEHKSRMPSSPSFNDFSLRVEEDAEEMGEWLHPACHEVLNSPLGTPTLAPPSLDLTRAHSIQDKAAPAGLLPTSALASQTSPTTTTASIGIPTSTPKRKRVTIMGMDAYDYCDLLRSSSL